MEFAKIILVSLVAYFIGTITTGDIVARIKGVDLRSSGSGNIGATNAFRVLGTFYGILVLVGDSLKGIVAVLLGSYFLKSYHGFDPAIVTGVMAIVGHNWPIHSGFKGGKGIATSLGVLIALTPLSILIVLPIWLVCFGLSGYVSLASIVAAIAYPISVYFLYSADLSRLIFAIAVAVLAVYRHHANIGRLIRGEENRILYKNRGGARK